MRHRFDLDPLTLDAVNATMKRENANRSRLGLRPLLLHEYMREVVRAELARRMRATKKTPEATFHGEGEGDTFDSTDSLSYGLGR